jgi:CheY-like chemotaxis protein
MPQECVARQTFQSWQLISDKHELYQVLHVLDEPSVGEAMSLLLRTGGCRVSSAASGRQAIQLVRAGFHTDARIADFNIDEQMNGAEVAEHIRGLPRYTPPVIMLSGNQARAELPWIVDVPAWLIWKPINPRLLLAALPLLVQLSRATCGVLADSSNGASQAGLARRGGTHA